jgi:ribosomal protein L19E
VPGKKWAKNKGQESRCQAKIAPNFFDEINKRFALGTFVIEGTAFYRLFPEKLAEIKGNRTRSQIKDHLESKQVPGKNRKQASQSRCQARIAIRQ